jgi:hypothetical protein
VHTALGRFKYNCLHAAALLRAPIPLFELLDNLEGLKQYKSSTCNVCLLGRISDVILGAAAE